MGRRFFLVALFILLFAGGAWASERSIFEEAEEHFEDKSYHLALESYEKLISDYPGSGYLPLALFKAAMSAEYLYDYEHTSEYFLRLAQDYPDTYWGALAMLKISENLYWWGNPELAYYQSAYMIQQLKLDAAAVMEKVKGRLDAPYDQECVDRLARLYMEIANMYLMNEDGSYVEDFDPEDWWWEKYERVVDLDCSPEIAQEAYFAMGNRELSAVYSLEYPETPPKLPEWRELMAERHSENAAILAQADRRWKPMLDKWPDCRSAYDVAIARAGYFEVFMDSPAEALGIYRDAAARFADTWDSYGSARDNATRLTTPHLQLPQVDGVQPTGEVVALSYTSRLADSAELRLYPIGSEELMAFYDGYYDKVDPKDDSRPDLTGWEPAAVYPQQLPGQDDYNPFYREITLPNPGPGLYLLAAFVDDEISSAVTFNVTDLGCVILGGDGAGYVWSAWLDDGTPAFGADVELWAEEGASPWYQELAREGTTDSDGWVEFSTPEEYLEYPIAVTEKDGHYAVADVYEFNALSGTQPVGYLITDRTLYKPGDTLNWELMVRREIEPSGRIYGYEQVKNLRLDIQVTAGDTIYEGEAVTDSRGRAGGSFDIPEDAQLGYIYFYAYYTDADEYQYSVCYSYIRLEEYKKPEFDVTVSLERGPLRLGGEAQAVVTAKYLYGEPVGAGEVRYTVTRTPRWWMPEITDEDKETIPSWFEEAGYYDDYYYWWWWYSPTQVYTSRVELDADGTAKFPVMLVGPEGDENQQFWDYGWYTYYYDFDLSLTVSDSSGRAVDGSARTNAARHLYMPTLTLEADTVESGNDLTGTFSLIDLFEEPAAGVGVTVTLNYVPDNYYNWDTSDLQGYLKIYTGVTGDDGAFDFALGTSGIEIGSYILVADFEDPWSGQRQHFSWAYVSEEPVEPEEILPSLTLTAEKDFYAVGDTARVTIGWNKSTVRGILLVESGGLVRETIPVTIREGETSQSVRLEGANAPLTTLRLLTFFERAGYTATVAVPVVPEEKVLAVGVEPSRASYAPAEKATLNLTVTDSAGRSVPNARLTVTVFDTALYVLGAEKHVDVRNFFFKNFNYGYLYQASSADYWTYYDFFDYWASPAGGLPHGWMVSQLGLTTEMDKLSDITTASQTMYLDGGGMGGGFAGDMEMAEGAAEPMMARTAEEAVPRSADEAARGSGGATGLIEELAGVIREEFKDTAYWQTQVKTDSRGRASVSFDLPDDLTGWQVVVWAFDEDRVGQDETIFRTVLPVVARLQYPRYLTERDETTLTLNVGNYTAKAATGQAGLVAEAEGAVELLTPDLYNLSIPAGGEQAFNFRLAAKEAGLVTLTGAAKTDRGSDALIRRLEVVPHGAPAFLFESGRAADDPYRFTFRLPEEIDPAQTHLRVWLHPSLAGSLKDAISFLQYYPYNCVEQTASRFWPAAIFAKAMHELGVPAGAVEGSAADSVNRGITRLYGQQNADGGWPWWAGGYSSEHITSYVMVALHEVGDVGWIDPDLESKRHEMADSGVRYLESLYDDLPADSTLNIYTLYALALWDAGVPEKQWRLVYDRRETLGSYSRALLALFLHENGDDREARLVVENMEGYADVTRDDAYWGHEYEWCWYWWQDHVETTALSLKAMLEIEPDHELMEKAAHWLLVNRRYNHWKSTIDTALSVWALIDYMDYTGELSTDYLATASLGSEVLIQTPFNPGDVWGDGVSVDRYGAQVQPGELPFVIEKDSGPGRLYFTAALEFYSKEEMIPARWDTVRCERDFYLVGSDGTTLTSLVDKDWTVKVGDYIEVVLTIESPNDFDYVAVEDPRVAGCEFLPKDRSGWDWQTGTYRELKEQLTAFFYDRLPLGEREIRYRVRAERPGVYHVMPTQLYGMYATDIRANSAERIITITSQ